MAESTRKRYYQYFGLGLEFRSLKFSLKGEFQFHLRAPWLRSEQESHPPRGRWVLPSLKIKCGRLRRVR